MPNNNTKPKEPLSKPPDRSPKTMTWPDIVRDAFKQYRFGVARLDQLYAIVEQHPRAKTAISKSIRAKVRQVLETSDQYVWFRKGTWALRSKLSKTAELEAIRRKFHSRRRKAVR